MSLQKRRAQEWLSNKFLSPINIAKVCRDLVKKVVRESEYACNSEITAFVKFSGEGHPRKRQ
jgi:hypothetical protein